MKILTAKFVLPISSEAIENGAVAIDGSEIRAVGSATKLNAEIPEAEVEDHGNAVIVPGFVNCHSHLELTAFRNQLDDVEHDFRSWLLKLNGLRAGLSVEGIGVSAIEGALEGARAGVTCFGDIGRMGHAGIAAIKQVGLRGVVFQETEFSPDDRTADEDFLALAAKYEKLREEETDLIRVGLSPHSPYTVSSRLFELIAQYSIINRVPLTIHAAESAEEISLLTTGKGFFTEVYEKFGLEWHSPHCTPIEYLERLGVLSTQPLLAHCVRVSDSDIDRIASYGAKIAHCPKSNAKFGHGYAPFEKFLNAGITVGLGSDSVASNNICDLIEESRFAALAARNRTESGSLSGVTPPGRFIQAKEVLETATLGGAKALNLDHLIGSLEPAKQADLAIISLDRWEIQPSFDIYSAVVFSANSCDVKKAMVAGRTVFSISEV
jgi:5-methylthioadenosine/S-adenosylhomocysteine deaminase